eukprot:SAG31_NODE_10522_length_1128_cov_2.357629_1_plen_58_part_00
MSEESLPRMNRNEGGSGGVADIDVTPRSSRIIAKISAGESRQRRGWEARTVSPYGYA